MSEEKEAFRRQMQLNLPPNYEEATSSTHSEAGDENEGENTRLLNDQDGQDPNGEGTQSRSQGRRRDGYQAPTVESVRSSFDSAIGANGNAVDGRLSAGTGNLRGEVEEMEIEEPDSQHTSTRLRQSLSKRWHRIGGAISSLSSSVGSRFGGFFARRIPGVTMPGFNNVNENHVILVQRLIGFIIVLVVIYALFVTDIFTIRNPIIAANYSPETVRNYMIESIQPALIRENLQYLTSFDHVAGTEGDFVMAQYMAQKLREAGLPTRSEQYEVYMNYPKDGGRRVAIVDPPSLRWEAKIEEENVHGKFDKAHLQTKVWHGHSKSGNVTGPLIYAGFGTREDFAFLKERKIDVKGTIVIMRYGNIDRGSKVRAAEMAGAIGVILYDDPKEKGFSRGKVWPEGPWLRDDAVTRGDVSYASLMTGDALTPGEPAVHEAKRLKVAELSAVPKIPSLPLGARDAKVLLKSLKGHGQKVPASWQGMLPKVEYYTGNDKSPKVNLVNFQVEAERQKIWNVIATIEGYEQSSKRVVIGTGRDAWCFGAADPMSGNAILLEIARTFGELIKKGWRPARTIEIISWDGGEFNMIGSTEHVEQHLISLKADAVAYINVKTAVSGSQFKAIGSPALKQALLDVLSKIKDPASTKMLREIWGDVDMPALGATSDYAPFQHVAGTASIDIGFAQHGFPFHSCYDTFEWMEKFGDPTWEYHAALARIWGVLTLSIADAYILPFNYVDYAESMIKHSKELENLAMTQAGSSENYSATGLSFEPFIKELNVLHKRAQQSLEFKAEWESMVLANDETENKILEIRRYSHNTRMSNFETFLLDNSGLPDRPFYKNTMFGPQLWNARAVSYLPGVRDALDKGDFGQAKAQLERARWHLEQATSKCFPR